MLTTHNTHKLFVYKNEIFSIYLYPLLRCHLKTPKWVIIETDSGLCVFITEHENEIKSRCVARIQTMSEAGNSILYA